MNSGHEGDGYSYIPDYENIVKIRKLRVNYAPYKFANGSTDEEKIKNTERQASTRTAG